MKKIILFLIAFFTTINIVSADSINSIKMDIYIDSNGDANVTEVWDVSINSGTEEYKPYYNLGNSKIVDFSVKSNYGDYTYQNNWNTNASFNSKAYKNGINQIADGVELCWGISKYGNNTYTLKYKITNFVLGVNDADIVYWTLIPHNLSLKPKSTYIKIYSDFKYNDTLDVWGYGNYGGTAYVYDGYIEASSDGELDSNEYLTLLIKFPLNTFNTDDNKVESNFDYYIGMSKEGEIKYQEEDNSFGNFLAFIMRYLIFIIIFIVGIVSAIISASKGPYRAGIKKLNKDVPFFRDIPCKGDIYRAYFTSNCFDLIKKKTDFLGAILLNWLKKEQIRIQKVTTGTIFKKEETAIVFEKVVPESQLEKEIYDMMYIASKDGVLESNEFEKWCKTNYKKILNWFDKALKYENELLVTDGSLNKTTTKLLGIFNKDNYTESNSFITEGEQLYGLKKYLIEFSNMKEKEPIEVHLWNDYLIYAQIFGMANQVAKQFKKLYPEVIQDYNYGFDDILFINVISNRGISSATTARSRAQSYSSGGGGFSSGGGGGGSFGGGGGGGGFR